MDSTDNATDTSHKIAALRVLFAAVAATGLPDTVSAYNPPPPMAFCAAGTWSSRGTTPCDAASLGHFVATEGATSQTPAPLGHYVDTTGATAAKRAPLGSYVDTVGASAATLAPLGRYVDTTGASVAKLASLGSYVDTVGASAAKPAPLGRYVDTIGASVAKLAPAGYFVDKTGQSAALAAPAGRFASGLGSSASAACPTGSNSYGAGSACRRIQAGYGGAGVVTPLLDSTFGTGGSHDLGSVLPNDSVVFKVTNTSADLATTGNLTALTLRSHTFSDPGLFDLVGFTNGLELAAGGGSASLLLHAKAGLPVGAFSVILTLNTDQNADYQAAGKQFSYTFTGLHAAAVPEPGSTALLLAGLGTLALLRRRPGPPALGA